MPKRASRILNTIARGFVYVYVYMGGVVAAARRLVGWMGGGLGIFLGCAEDQPSMGMDAMHVRLCEGDG